MAGLILSFNQASAQIASFTLNPGASVTIHGQAANAAGYQWYKNGVAIPGANSADYKASEAGMYKVQALNIASCASPVSKEVQVIMGTTSVDMSIVKKSEDKNVNVGTPYSYTLTVKNNSTSPSTNVTVTDALPSGLEFVSLTTWNKGLPNYDQSKNTLTWSAGDFVAGEEAQLLFLARPDKSGAIINQAVVTADQKDVNTANNTSVDTKQVLGINVPNVFTPNGDGKNDTFEIPELSAFPENEIVIINRWGNVVYQKTGYHNDWTGEGLNEGTYFYVLKVKYLSGVWETYKGYITLLRAKQTR
jgi:gliding motility-associated-like protein/uncharacterized repeat protein (TIGR01451 family)